MNSSSTNCWHRGGFRLLALLLAFGLVAAACGDDDSGSDDASGDDTSEEASGDADLPTMAVVLSGQVNDYSWNQAAYDGAQTLKDEGIIADFAYQEDVADADVERAVRAYAEDGYDVIVAHSFNYGEAVKALAPDYPDTLFAYAGGFGDSSENVADYAQPFHETAYLQGILGAGLSENFVVAGAAGFDIPVCKSMFEAYLLGAQLVNPDTTGTYLAVGDWNDVQLGKETALGQADGGADMFIGCGQGPTLGQIEAAKETPGATVVGYVNDMTELGPEVVLTSTIWRLDTVFRAMVEDAVNGDINPARYYEFTFADDGMDIAINEELAAGIPADVMEIYEAEYEKVRSGEFVVPFDAGE